MDSDRAKDGSAVVLLSGGMDSSALLRYASCRHERLYALTFIYGQKHSKEAEMAKAQAASIGATEHRVINVSWLGEMIGEASALTGVSAPVPSLDEVDPADRDQPHTYVPHRNMILLSVGAAFAESRGSKYLYYGAHEQDRHGYWDCTLEFVEQINEVLRLNRRTAVLVKAPFVGMTKEEVLRVGTEYGVDYANTWTCYRGGETPCGECPSCAERAKAFRAAGLMDPALMHGKE